MIDFTDPAYLANGNPRQQSAFRILQELKIFELFESCQPLLAGTTPIGIDLEESDLDVILEVHDREAFYAQTRHHFGEMPEFRQKPLDAIPEERVVVTFRYAGREVQLYGEPRPPVEQHAWRHMIQEWRVLSSAGHYLREQVIELKRSGMNTEEAFCHLLWLDGDPFRRMLELEALDDISLAGLVMERMYQAQIREISEQDDLRMAAIIRSALQSYGVAGEGTAFADPGLDRLSGEYLDQRAAYFVIEAEGRVAGGAGIAPLEHGPEGVCELQKMYLEEAVRGKGFGRALMRICLAFARNAGYTGCYLETFAELKEAVQLYKSEGFRPLDKRTPFRLQFGRNQ